MILAALLLAATVRTPIQPPITALTMNAGDTRRVETTIPAVQWSTSDRRLVHVTADGQLYGRPTHGGGKAIVEARAANGATECFVITVPPFAPSPTEELRIEEVEDIARLREALVREIWPDGYPSARQPDLIERSGGPFPTANTELIERITVEMSHRIDVVHYLIQPQCRPNGKLVVYVDGHSDTQPLAFPTAAMAPADAFVRQGYAVLVVSMPLFGPSSRPILSYPGWPKVRMNAHDDLWLLQTPRLSPLQFFLEPLLAAVNHMKTSYGYDVHALIGASGGGWLGLLFSAIDERPRTLITVAGYISSDLTFGVWGDAEQAAPEIVGRVAGYRDLAVMAGHRLRSQHHVITPLNRTSYANGAEQFYDFRVRPALERTAGGRFETILDYTTTQHELTPWATQRIFEILGAP